MNYLLCTIIGYALGCTSPSYLLSKIKKEDIRKSGTGNLGATNTFFHFGKRWGIMVMIFDVLKAYFAVKLCQILFPGFLLAGIIAGTAAVLGHMFPFYLRFHGGKGLACLGGFVLATDVKYFAIIFVVGCILSIIVNYGCCLPFTAAAFFPIMYAVEMQSLQALFVLLLCSVAIVYKHMDNVIKIRAGEELSVREFFNQKVLKRCD